MGIKFNALSISEANETYRSVILANHANVVQKVFTDVGEQVGFHARHGAGLADNDIDIGVTGSPCNPFSTQRSKRYATGDVASHISFEVTMVNVIGFYTAIEPRLGVSEQVAGFDQPFSRDQRETPLQMLLAL